MPIDLNKSGRERWTKSVEETPENKIRQIGFNAARLAKTKEGRALLEGGLKKLENAITEGNPGIHHSMNALRRNEFIKARIAQILGGQKLNYLEKDAYFRSWPQKEGETQKSRDQELKEALKLVGVAHFFEIEGKLPEWLMGEFQQIPEDQVHASFAEGWNQVQSDLDVDEANSSSFG